MERKVVNDYVYPKKDIIKEQSSNILEELSEGTFISRCSFVSSKQKVTCDKYKMDKKVVDDFVGVKKYYHFNSQFDFQLFEDLQFIENNGRGGVSYGHCK